MQSPSGSNNMTMRFVIVRDEAKRKAIGDVYRQCYEIYRSLDGVYIGPADLTLGLTGRKYPTGFDREEPEMIEAIKEILARAHEAGIKACLHCGSSAYAARAIGWGFDMVTLLNDVRLLASSAKASVEQARKLIGEQVADAPAPRNAGY